MGLIYAFISFVGLIFFVGMFGVMLVFEVLDEISNTRRHKNDTKHSRI